MAFLFWCFELCSKTEVWMFLKLCYKQLSVKRSLECGALRLGKNRQIRPVAETLGYRLGLRRGGKAPKVARGPQWAAATPNGANCQAAIFAEVSLLSQQTLQLNDADVPVSFGSAFEHDDLRKAK